MFKTIVKNMEEAREKDDLVSTNTIGLQDFNKKKFK